MIDRFTRLTEQTQELGNHHRKYLHFISLHKDGLVERLDELGMIDRVHLWSAAPDVEAEMAVVCDAGRDHDEKLAFLGCFFALQLLNMNTRAVNVLRLGLESPESRYRVYREFMLQMGRDLRALSASYMKNQLDLFLPPEERPKFVICGVGTRADQDDLDLGIVVDGADRRAGFNKAIGRIQREMLRRAVPLHFHLSEHVGEVGFAASIDEYTLLLDREIQDFIIITEMLGARPILGDNELFKRFTEEVTDRYYYNHEGGNRYHEGYLRGMLGELRSLMLRPLRRESVNPKRDALRIIKGILFVGKTIFGIKEVNAWAVLDQLVTRYPRDWRVYEKLEEALSFVEVFRFLYQLLEVQEEEVLLKEKGSRRQLDKVAELMGYQDDGVVRAYDHLLVHYHEHVQAVRRMTSGFLEDSRRHLQQISVFSSFLQRRDSEEKPSELAGNLAVEFVSQLRFFRGTRFWDDVMEPMEENTELLCNFVEAFNSLDPEERKIWVNRYAKWGEVTSIALLRLLVILHRRRRLAGSTELYRELSDAFIDRMGRRPDAIPRVTAVFDRYPQLVNDFLVGLREEQLRRFMAIFEGAVWSEGGEVIRRRLLHFINLHCFSSHYFKRFFQRIVANFPAYTAHFNRTEKLAVIAKGIFSRIEHLQSFAHKKTGLGNYYDLEFLRIGLECMGGAPSEQTNAEFTEFSDNYLQVLFDVCKQEVEQEDTVRVPTRDLLALYSAGGHGRKLAFDDDYDLVVLLNSDEPDMRRFCGRIITRMNREIVRRGTMPHFRFAEHFGEYVTTFSELRGLFTDPDEYTFIDMGQLLGARKLVGSKKIESDLRSEIIEPLILARNREFIAEVAGEISSRHEAVRNGVISPMDVKETRGGLRDMELLLMILMAHFRIWHPVTHELRGILAERMEHRKDDLDRIFESYTFIKRCRDIYRLTVAAEDEMLEEEVGYLAYALGYCDEPECRLGRASLVDKIASITNEAAGIVDSFLEEVVG